MISNEVLSRHKVYGVIFNGISSKGKPLYNAIDQKWVPATPTSPGVDTWKDLAPFNVKKCITDYDASTTYKRKVLTYEDTDPKTYSSLKASKTGDRMIEFPLGYYYRPDPWTFIVSPDPIEGFQPSPGHDLGNGTILKAFRRSEFDMSLVNSIPRSIPGYSPWVNVGTIDSMTLLKNRGLYHQTFGAWCWINFLRLIKQGDLNSQKINGRGIHSVDGTKTLVEDNIQGLDGYVTIDGNNDVRTLGIQNFYGHVFNSLHNVLVSRGTKVWTKKDFTSISSFPTYANAILEGWEELEITMPMPNSDYVHPIIELAFNPSNPYALYASKIDDNAWPDSSIDRPEPIGDMFTTKINDPWSCVFVGCPAWYKFCVGSLSWNSWNPPSYGYRGLGVAAIEAV